jgi:hypothetical protein
LRQCAAALATLGVLWPLGLTNRILAGIDAPTYFTYWAYRNEALRRAHPRVESPPLLRRAFPANIQSAVLYRCTGRWHGCPPSAPSSGRQSCTWLASALTYALCAPLRPTPLAVSAGAVFGLGGLRWRAENINQLNGLAWLPGLLWMADETIRPRNGRSQSAGPSPSSS